MNYLRISIFLFFVLTKLSAQTYTDLHIKVTEQSYLLRSDNYGSKLRAIVPKGKIIKVLERVKQDMYKVEYGNKVGYMMDIYFPDEIFKGVDANGNDLEDNANNLKSELPPIIHIMDISFFKDPLYAETMSELTIKVKNSGSGDAKDVYVKLSGTIQGLRYEEKTFFPLIKAKGGEEELIIPITGEHDLSTGEATIDIEVVEPNFEVNHSGMQLKFSTVKAEKPILILAKHTLIENLSAAPNRQIDLNEMIDLKFVVQNIGIGEAHFVSIDVNNDQKGVTFMGAVKDNKLVHGKQIFDKIDPGDYVTLTFRYFVNNNIEEDNLVFNISSHERHGKYGFIETKSYPINGKIASSGYIRTIESSKVEKKVVIVRDVPDFQVDVDVNIPETNKLQENTYVLAIGNQDYQAYQKGLSSEQNVDFAINDVEVFSLYCEKTLGIPKRQIMMLKNATSAQIKQGIAWLSNLAEVEKGQAKLIFYYSGHGLPHEETKEAYLIPVDVSGNNVDFGININELYSGLTKHPSQQISVFLDACFSGGGRNQGLVAVKGVKVRPKKNEVSGRMVVFSSSSGAESSSVYNEKHHGYFTYFLLKKIQETNGDVDFQSLGSFINNKVRKETGIIGKIQTPEVNYSLEVENEWHNWELN